MDSKSIQAPIKTTPVVKPVDGIIYIAVKGSVHAHDCSVFGLQQDDIRAIYQKYPGSGPTVVNGINIKANVINVINSLSQLGYKIVSSTGEAETTWTMQREI